MAGKAGRSGRKSKAEEAGLAALIDSAVSDSDWRAIFRKAANKAKRGDMVAAKFLAEFRFGRPALSIELSGPNKGPISVKAFDYGTAIAAIAPRPETDSESPGAGEGDSDGPPLGEDAHGG